MQRPQTTVNILALATAGAVAVVGLTMLSQGRCSDDISGDTDQSVAGVVEAPVPMEAPQDEFHGPDHRAADVVETSVRMADEIDERNSRRPSPLTIFDRQQIIEQLGGREPEQWGEFVDGVHRRLDTDERKVALTLDACDRGFDEQLIELLRNREIAATLFVSGHWIDAHRKLLREFAEDPLFEIANHGLRHLPCSVSGESFLDIQGTDSVAAAYREIEENAQKIEEVTGERPEYYRSGTAHYDEVCTEVARMTGHRVAGFDVVGDLGATYSSEQVEQAVNGVESGSVVVVHMNKPAGGTTDGLREALPRLQEQGYEFVRLSQVELR